MKVVKIILITLAILVGLVILVGLFLPNKMEIEKSIVVDAPPNVPYSQVANLRNMPKWDPWSNIDTTMETTYSGAPAGVGSKRVWKSKNENVGIGSMVVTKAEPYSFIETDLDFAEQGMAKSYFKFEKVDNNKTKVTWGFNSDVDIPILGGYLCLIMGPIVEAQYDQGLQNLKKVSEEMANKSDLTNRNITVENVDSQTLICISGATTQDDSQISQKFAQAYGQLVTNIQVNGMEMAGPPLTITTKWEDNQYNYNNCIPVQNIKGELSATVFDTKSYSGPVAKLEYIGPYMQMESAYNDIMAYIEQNGFEIVGSPWEVYISDPSDTPEDKLITHIYFPIK